MRRFFSFYGTREAAEVTTLPPQLPRRKTQEIARQSLINVGGTTYPLLQRASMWNFAEEVDQGVTFTFNRQRPYGDIHFDPDLSFQATREPTDDEAEPTLIFLEALTWELVFTMVFFNKFIGAFGRPGTFRIGLGFAGFQDALVDWVGFKEDPKTLREEGKLINWRFQPPKEVVAYEVPGIEFPVNNNDDLVAGIVEMIAEASFAVRGIRRTALGRDESRLTLARESIEGVVKAALQQVKS